MRSMLVFFLALAAGCGRSASSVPASPPAQSTSISRTADATKAPLAGPGWPYVPSAFEARGAQAMVVSDATLGTRVGVDVLRAGGNAIDAAIATAFALAVVYPEAGNLGGGGFMVARVDGKDYALDFRETAPAAAKRELFVDPAGGSSGASLRGYRAAGVPGSVAGLYEAYTRLGSKKKTWAELIAPSIALAERGFVVDHEFAISVKEHAETFAKDPASAALYLPHGAPLVEGSTWANPELAQSLRRIADHGPDGFYKGPTAATLARVMAEHDGLITEADLQAYRAKWRTPLAFTYRGHTIVSMPPPSSGGVTLAMLCNILSSDNLGSLGWQSPAALHLELEAMRRAFAARNAALGDPDFVQNPLEALLSPAWAKGQRATFKPGRATPSSELPSAPASGVGPHTTHFSVVDAQGNAVALTTTINWFYGNGITVAGAGFLLNNEMDDFAVAPGTPNGFGLVQGEPNALAPNKRMLSSMTPTIVTDGQGRVELVLGAAGGPTIITSVFQNLINVIDFKQSVGAAVVAPRLHEQHLPDVVMSEAHGLADSTRRALEAMGYTFKERAHIADAPAIGRDARGWVGVAEPRRAGSLAAGY
jgi:gamma-glutamyltranspeptidase/glutathione hydrolase